MAAPYERLQKPNTAALAVGELELTGRRRCTWAIDEKTRLDWGGAVN
jgi:hypothetical protein